MKKWLRAAGKSFKVSIDTKKIMALMVQVYKRK